MKEDTNAIAELPQPEWISQNWKLYDHHFQIPPDLPPGEPGIISFVNTVLAACHKDWKHPIDLRYLDVPQADGSYRILRVVAVERGCPDHLLTRYFERLNPNH